jgi:hypothetical protein
MTDPEIVDHIRQLFDPATSPGQAFDALFRLRQARVMYQDVFNAILRSGSALDDSEDQAVSASPRLTRLPKEAVFKNPALSFGKYRDKTLLVVCDLDPGYVKWMAENHNSDFWREQAKLAIIAFAASAPLERDPDATGYFDA